MAVVATTTYLYVDTSLLQHFIQGADLVDRGAWSSATTYNALNVAQIGAEQYVALQTNTNSPPSGVVDENWSILVIVEEAAGSVAPSAGSDYYARFTAAQALGYAVPAYTLALNGTVLIATESGTRLAADNALQALLVVETGSREAADAALSAFVIGSLGADLVAESGSRIAADNALQVLITAEAGSRTAEDAAEAVTRAAADQQIMALAAAGTSIANDAYAISVAGTNLGQQLSAILGVSFQGTLNLFTSQVRYGKADTTYTIINGIVANRQESKFVWEDFDLYSPTTGTSTPLTGMNGGSSWNSYGSIFTHDLVTGVAGTDWMNLYPPGTISNSTLNDGTGWNGAGTSWGDVYHFRFLGMEDFQAYAPGTLSASGTEINAGGGWIGTALCYQGTNRP